MVSIVFWTVCVDIRKQSHVIDIINFLSFKKMLIFFYLKSLYGKACLFKLQGRSLMVVGGRRGVRIQKSSYLFSRHVHAHVRTSVCVHFGSLVLWDLFTEHFAGVDHWYSKLSVPVATPSTIYGKRLKSA